jgi:hypothetical protein
VTFIKQPRYLRLPVTTVVCRINDSHPGTILNVSEGGIAIQPIAPVNCNRPFQIKFDCVELNASVEATGRIAWVDRSERAGLRFSALPETSRARLIEWLFQSVALRCTAVAHAQREQKARAADSPPVPVDSTLHTSSMETLRITALITADNHAPIGGLELRAILDLMAKRAQSITQSSGAAIALASPTGSVVCVARSGSAAPDLGVHLDAHSGLSGECLRTGAVTRCDDLEKDPRADRTSCQHLGVRSTLVLPLRRVQGSVAGVLGVFSTQPSAFNDYDVATLLRMTSSIIGAMKLFSPSVL